MFVRISAFLALTLGLGACLSNVELVDEIRAKENQAQITAYFTKLGQSPTAMENGAYYVLTKTNPSGELATKGDTLSVHFEFANLVTGQVLDSTDRKNNAPFVYLYGFTNPVFSRLMAFLREGEQAVLALPGTAQEFPGLPAYTPMRVTIKSYKVRSQADNINEFIAARGYNVTETTEDGLRFIQLVKGTGELAASGKVVKVKYTGRFLNGVAFDGNMLKTDSLSVTIGGSQTVKGFQKGIEKMRLGEKAILVFPSTLGYGQAGSGSIPGYTPLMFEVYLAKINE
ncbi:FKBP-type peptidyl-prolyl cis-trans isomerase [Aquirufa sp. Wall-65K1]